MCDSCFYKNGLYFKCQKGCVKCCSGEPGVVFLSDDDIANIAKATGLEVHQAKEVYTRYYEAENGKTYTILKEYSNNACIFLGRDGCTIYPYRPLQCSTYPFWPRVVASNESWQSERRFCPGIGDESNLVGKSTIDSELAKSKQIFD